MDTTATIPTGAMAERWKWKALRRLGPLLRRDLLPALRRLDLGRRLAGQLGNSDRASASATSTSPAPAWCTPWAASPRWPARSCSGPASASTTRTASRDALPGHHIPMAMLGTFILLFGWFGFNAASTLAATDVQFAVVAANTAHRRRLRRRRRDVLDHVRGPASPIPGMMANGMLAGLVAITAPCAFVDPWAAAVIGVIAGVLVVESVCFFERKLKVDDPVGAISVHGVCGIFGVLSVGHLRQRQVRRRAGTAPSTAAKGVDRHPLRRRSGSASSAPRRSASSSSGP